jgi:hypothetical protein
VEVLGDAEELGHGHEQRRGGWPVDVAVLP